MTDLQTLPAEVAVVGCGHWGRNLVRVFAELGALATVCDEDRVVAAQQAIDNDVSPREWKEILGDSQITSVAIATPAALHGTLAREALAAGKHVFVEKPLALDVAEAEELCDIAEDAGRCLMVGHLLQYHPAFRKLEDLVRSGVLGRLQYVYSNRLNLGKVRREENILWSFAPHDISMILSLLGEEPESVSAVGHAYLQKEIADVTTTQLTFPGGVRAHVFVSWLHPFKEQRLVVVGTEGMAVFDDGEPWERKVLRYPHKIDWVDEWQQPTKADAVAELIDQDEPLKLECQHFLDCVISGATPRTDGREGLRVLRVLQAAEQAMARDKPRAQAAHPGVTIHESAYIDAPCEIGEGTRIWHFCHILKDVKIGRDCVIGQNVMIGPEVCIGDKCKIQNNVSVYKGVTLADGVFCGPSCVFTNVTNPRAGIERKDEFRPTPVGEGVTIGANATILCGHEIGAHSFIAAGAVVTADVPEHALMAGVPARRIGWVSHAGEKLGDDLVCQREGRRYREAGPDRLEEIFGD